jgi:hypothetical protein
LKKVMDFIDNVELITKLRDEFIAYEKQKKELTVVDEKKLLVKLLEQQLSEAKAVLEQAEVEYFATRDPCLICKREESVRKCFHCDQRYGLGCEMYEDHDECFNMCRPCFSKEFDWHVGKK